jgi:hyperosmotically inducible protein
MQMKSLRFGLTLCLTAAIAIAGLTACRSSGDRSSGRVMDDRMVNRRVKGALSSSTMYKFPDVRAQTYAGVVQLSGFVESQDQRAQAAALAANVQGVHEVVNSLVLKPQETTLVTTPGTVPMSGTPTPPGSTTTITTTTPTGSTTSRRYYDSDVSPPGNANPGTNPNQTPNTPKNPQNPNSNQPQ